jgi:hypothetical protein
MKWLDKLVARTRRPPTLNKVVRRSFFASFVFHGALLLVAGVFVISHVFFNRESTFTGQPPPTKSYKPREIELKVKVSRQQRSSSRPSMAPRLVSARESTSISLPEIKLDSKIVNTTFQSKFKAFSGKGLGVGTGTGYGKDGFGAGVSDINFFGIQAKGERIAILVDVSVSMIEPEKGGATGYLRVKQRVNDVIDALKDGTQFNLIVFADACSVMDSKMLYANAETRQRAKTFLRPFNTEGNYGLDSGNFNAGSVGVPASGGTTRLDQALTAAMQQGADTVMIISDGLPRVMKPVDAARMQAYAQQVSQWNTQHAGEVAAYNQAVAAAPAERVWIPPTPARPPSPAPLREGAKPDPGAPAVPGHWEVVRSGGRVGVPRPQPPPAPQPTYWTLADFVQHMTILYDSIYKPKGLKQPSVHCIGYQIDKDGGAFLNDLARQYRGQYRLVRKMK